MGQPRWLGAFISLTTLIGLSGSAYSESSVDLALVTCGSTIKLAHAHTKFRLHSHQVSYSHGSRQQSVTAFPDSDDANSYWVVHGTLDKPCTPGHPVRKGQHVRLQHSATRRWLHSHLFQSPLTGNQEVSAFGNDATSDGGDVWTIDWDKGYKFWKQDRKVSFQHKDTSGWLHSSHATFGHPIAGQHEVCTVRRRDLETQWFAAEGIYLPRTDKKPKEAAAAGEAAAAADGGSGGDEKDEL